MKLDRKGFSLFEVLIAFAIMAIVLSVLMPGQTRLLQQLDTSEERVLAMDYAVSLAELESLSSKPELGRIQFEYRGWRVVRELKRNSTNDMELAIIVAAGSGQTLARLTSTRPLK